MRLQIQFHHAIPIQSSHRSPNYWGMSKNFFALTSGSSKVWSHPFFQNSKITLCCPRNGRGMTKRHNSSPLFRRRLCTRTNFVFKKRCTLEDVWHPYHSTARFLKLSPSNIASVRSVCILNFLEMNNFEAFDSKARLIFVMQQQHVPYVACDNTILHVSSNDMSPNHGLIKRKKNPNGGFIKLNKSHYTDYNKIRMIFNTSSIYKK